MHAIVCIKSVPDTTEVRFDPETNTLIRDEVESIINPFDTYAIEEALRLKEAHGGKVTVLSMGPPKAEKELKEAIAMGCDEAVLLSAREFAGADTWATSYTLAQAIQKIGDYDIILCGKQAMDGDTGQVGPAIASRLDLPLATYVRRIYDISAKGLRVERMVEGGSEILWTPLPALLTVVKEIAYPRLPTLRGKQRARRTELPVWKPADIEARVEWLGLKGSPTRVVKIRKPQVARRGTVIRVRDQGDVDRAATRLIQFLRERQLWRPET